MMVFYGFLFSLSHTTYIYIKYTWYYFSFFPPIFLFYIFPMFILFLFVFTFPPFSLFLCFFPFFFPCIIFMWYLYSVFLLFPVFSFSSTSTLFFFVHVRGILMSDSYTFRTFTASDRPGTWQDLHDAQHIVDRMVHDTREDSLQHQRCDPLDDFRRCVDAVNNRHASNVVNPCLVLLCFVLSCLVFSCLVLSCLAFSCLALSCLVWSCFFLFCLMLSYLVFSDLLWSYLVRSSSVLSYLILSYLVRSCLILSASCLTLSSSRLMLSCLALPCLVRHLVSLCLLLSCTPSCLVLSRLVSSIILPRLIASSPFLFWVSGNFNGGFPGSEPAQPGDARARKGNVAGLPRRVPPGKAGGRGGGGSACTSSHTGNDEKVPTRMAFAVEKYYPHGMDAHPAKWDTGASASSPAPLSMVVR